MPASDADPLRGALAGDGWAPDGDAWHCRDAVFPYDALPDNLLGGWKRHDAPFAIVYTAWRDRQGAVRFDAALVGYVAAPFLGRAAEVVEGVRSPLYRSAGVPEARAEMSGERVVCEQTLAVSPSLREDLAAAARVADTALLAAACALHSFGMPLEGDWRVPMETPPVDPADDPILAVTMAREPGLGFDPAASYVVTVHADGRVDWNDEPTLAPGLVLDSARIDTDAAERLFRLFESPFFGRYARRQARDPLAYGSTLDVGSSTITVRRRSGSLSFTHTNGEVYDGAVHVHRLCAAVARAADVERWIRYDEPPE